MIFQAGGAKFMSAASVVVMTSMLLTTPHDQKVPQSVS
jgi:hypothetical protein